MGWSQGGTNALLAAAAYPETFSAVVTWAGALDLTGLFGETSFADAKAKAEADGAFTMTLDWRTPSDLPVGVQWFKDVESTDVLAETAKIKAPVLAIHGEDDDTVPPASAGQIAEAAADGQTHMIPGCDHTFNVFSGDFTALNDAVISKGSMARVAEMEVLADRVKVTAITGDGVIVATPTGSTAYSMSAGGPIVEPTSSCILITPVCAHQLAVRAMVLAPERVVTVQLPRGNRKYLYLSVDGGKAVRLTGGDRVEVRQSERATQLVRLADRSFYQVVNQKLGGLSQ